MPRFPWFPTLRILLLLASSAVAAWSVEDVWQSTADSIAADFYVVYVNVCVAGRDDVPNIYTPDAQKAVGEEFFARALDSGSRLHHENATNRRSLDSSSSPFLYASFAWISRDYETALRQYRALLIAAYFAGIMLLGRYCRLPPWITMLLFALLVGSFLPFRGDLIVGNVNAIQLFLLALALTVSERRPEIAGAILAMLLAAKPNVVFVVVILIAARIVARDFTRLRRELIGGAIGGAIAFTTASLFFDTPRIWIYWIESVRRFGNTLRGVEFNNVTPVLRLCHEYGTWISLVAAAVLVAIVCTVLFSGAKREDLLLISLGVLIYDLSSTLVWLHYLVLAILPAFALFRMRETVVISAVALLHVADVPYELLLGPSTPHVRAWLIPVAMVMLYGGCVWMLWRGRGRIPATSAGPA